MSPRQVFPHDEGGGGLHPSPRHFLVDASRTKWAGTGPSATDSVESAAPFAPPPLPLSTSELGVCKQQQQQQQKQQQQQQHSSDLHDALNDDDDDGGEGSVDLGANWASGGGRDNFVPRRGVEIFVGGLTRSTRRDMLRDWFQHAGEVTEVRIARDKRRRRCRGYGYVRFATSEQANRAIDTMHRFEFKHGRFLGVLPSDENRTLFVGGLREEWSCEYISQLLKETMPGLRKVEPIPDREDRLKIRTFCFLEFASHAEAAVIFNRHHTAPRPSSAQPQQAANTAPPSQSPSPPGLASLKLVLSCGSGLGGGDGGDLFFERGTRETSTSTCTTSCASNGGGDCCRFGACWSGGGGDENGLDPGSAATTADTAPTSASPDTGGGGGALRFDGSGLWGRQQHLGLEDNDGGEFCGDNGEGGGRGDLAGGGDEAGTGATVPLVVGGATLKVDWADPLRYHIHLNGGIKGPSASPEFGMPPDHGRPCSHGGGDDGGFPGGRVPQPGSGAPGNVCALGGRGGVGSHWQQHQQQRRGPQEQHLPPSSLLSDPRWQDGDRDHPGRGVAPQGQQHQWEQQQQQQQQHRLDVSCDRRPSHLSHNGGVLRVPTRERRYTIAAGYAASRRSPFDADVHDGGGGGGGRSIASQQQHPGFDFDDRPRSKSSSSHFHTSRVAAAAAASQKQQDYIDARIAIPPSVHHHRDHHHHHHHRQQQQQARLQPHPKQHAGPPEGSQSQDLDHPRTDMVGVPGGGGGARGGMHDSPEAQRYHHHHHHRHGHGYGHGHHPHGSAASRGIPTGRPYSASPDISAGRHGRRRQAFSAAAYSGGGGGDGSGTGDGGHGDGSMPPSRSASCHHFGEQQQQRHVSGAGGDNRALLSPPPSWERHASSSPADGGNTAAFQDGHYSLGALDLLGFPWDGLSAAASRSGGVGQRHKSAPLHGGHLSGAMPVFDGQRAQRRRRQQQQQQQQQRWESPGVRDRAADASSVMMQDLPPPPPLDGGGGGRDISNNNLRFTPADLATIDGRFEPQQQQQQQQRSEQFSNTVSAAAPQPHTRRHTLSGGLDVGLGIGSSGSSSQDNGGGGGNPPPPGGFLASCPDDAWGAGAPGLPPHAGGGGAASAEGGPAAPGMHLGSSLWESMGAEGLDFHERSSWPSALLSPGGGETGGGDRPWVS